MQKTITIEGGLEKKTGGVMVWSLWSLFHLIKYNEVSKRVSKRFGKFRVTPAVRGRYRLEKAYLVSSMYAIRDTVTGKTGHACKSQLRKALAPLSVRIGARFNVVVLA